MKLTMVALAALCCGNVMAVEQRLEVIAPCDAAAQPCHVRGAGGEITVALVNPRVMQPFTMRLELNGMSADAVLVSFEMVGMDMGDNRYRLVSDGKGTWSGSVVLPMCSMGRSDWIAEIQVRRADTAYRARVPFTIR